MRRGWRDTATRKATLVLAQALVLIAVFAGSAVAQSFAYGGPFSLTASDGTTVTEQSYRGRVLIVYFGYTFCPDACPTALAEIAAALDALGPDGAAVQPLFITIDPRRDTAAVLAEYLKAFHPRLLGLTGAPAEIAALARRYGVIYERAEGDDDDDNYLIDHTSSIYVMGRNGAIARTLPGDRPGAAIAEAVAEVLKE
jgi:protein SCO1